VNSPGRGAIDAARDGTLLLHDIDSLSIPLQVRLIKALFQDLGPRNGAIQAPHANVRLICTTSHDLMALMKAGQFRKELYYRINVLPIEVPPLGRRREDIPLLVSHFLQQATKTGGFSKIYSPQALELLATTDWPGNVRQLFDLVKKNVALSQDSIMSEDYVRRSLRAGSTGLGSYEDARNDFSRDYLSKLLETNAGNISKSARLAKRNRTDFYKLLSRYRLHAEDFKTGDRPVEIKRQRSYPT
jgi:two-component system response regulator GlrR